jgi:hypothetical protein
MKRDDAKKNHPAPRRKPAASGEAVYPAYCDFSCEHASFGDPAAVGACRRDIGVWCAAAGRYNNKHARCLLGGAR